MAVIIALFSLQMGYLAGLMQASTIDDHVLSQKAELGVTRVDRGGLPPSPLANANKKGIASSSSTNDTEYIPAPIEDYLLKRADDFGYNVRNGRRPRVCTIFKDRNLTTIYDDLHQYMKELDQYNVLLNNFTGVPDVRPFIDQDPDICSTVELHPDGLSGIFKSGQISNTRSGFVEPLLPPLRHPGLCFNRSKYFLDMSYLVHDFGAMCRQLKRHSRTVLIDMGASLAFHDGVDAANQPARYLPEIFERFGMPFDHIYAFEVTKQEPEMVFELVPDKLKAAFHWINVGVDPTPGASMNPLTMLLNKYNKDDLIVVKLDVDTPSVERPLSQQLLRDERFGELVDHFYFEHHVNLKEMAFAWAGTMKGSVKGSLELFSGLRKKGIASHYWP